MEDIVDLFLQKGADVKVGAPIISAIEKGNWKTDNFVLKLTFFNIGRYLIISIQTHDTIEEMSPLLKDKKIEKF